MGQTTLSTMFSKQRCIPEVLGIALRDGGMCITFEKDNLRYIKDCNIRFEKQNFTISLYSDASLLQPYEFKTENIFSTKAIPFLKSLLQKGIRRGCVNNSLFACHALLQLDHMSLYRRLPIIMVEDVWIDEMFAPLVWHMMANIPPSFIFYQNILKCVKGLCFCKKTFEYGSLSPVVNFTTLKQFQSYLHWCVFFRMMYGGMHGDINMLAYVIQMKNINPTQCNIDWSDADISFPGALLLFDAVDFHISPKIVKDSEDIKKMMWTNASSINFRKDHIPYKFEEWQFLHMKIEREQKNFVQSLLQKSV